MNRAWNFVQCPKHHTWVKTLNPGATVSERFDRGPKHESTIQLWKQKLKQKKSIQQSLQETQEGKNRVTRWVCEKNAQNVAQP
jgi:short-subunit dehydrogenase